ncbi:hypothetical protein HK22_09000 [Gluconobacter sp. DsW_056]|uniref:hypothetical protein n=1 Tax=Gluconobacter sp. DsW_056 TaxID=1511209 RepID=UPI000A3AB07A|nr:hypothetical protein [Gluconobacter sp. DsW_056]OUI83565.1 hypothetical protein HK22_09000 [Gluconobacter sp. DsW_056]
MVFLCLETSCAIAFSHSGLGALLLGSTAACTTTQNTATFNTVALNNDATAVSYAAPAQSPELIRARIYQGV